MNTTSTCSMSLSTWPVLLRSEAILSVRDITRKGAFSAKETLNLNSKLVKRHAQDQTPPFTNRMLWLHLKPRIDASKQFPIAANAQINHHSHSVGLQFTELELQSFANSKNQPTPSPNRIESNRRVKLVRLTRIQDSEVETQRIGEAWR